MLKNIKFHQVSQNKLTFFEGKSAMHNIMLGTVQHALVGRGDLAGQSSDLTAGKGGKVKVVSSSEGIENRTSI